MNNKNGFTLIELLASMAIAAIMIAAIGSLLMSGSRLVTILDSRKDAALELATIALEKMTREIQRSPDFAALLLKGETGSLSFAALLPLSVKGALNAEFRLGQIQKAAFGQGFAMKKVEYFFDAGRKALMRKTELTEPEVWIDRLEGATFSYAVAAKDGFSWEWKDKTPAEAADGSVQAISVYLKFDRNAMHYGIPGFYRTFLIARENEKS